MNRSHFSNVSPNGWWDSKQIALFTWSEQFADESSVHSSISFCFSLSCDGLYAWKEREKKEQKRDISRFDDGFLCRKKPKVLLLIFFIEWQRWSVDLVRSIANGQHKCTKYWIYALSLHLPQHEKKWNNNEKHARNETWVLLLFATKKKQAKHKQRKERMCKKKFYAVTYRAIDVWPTFKCAAHW